MGLIARMDSTEKRTMETFQEKGLIGFTETQENPCVQGGRPGAVYLVNQRDSSIFVAEINAKLTAKLVDRCIQPEVMILPNLYIALTQSSIVNNGRDSLVSASVWFGGESSIACEFIDASRVYPNPVHDHC